MKRGKDALSIEVSAEESQDLESEDNGRARRKRRERRRSRKRADSPESEDVPSPEMRLRRALKLQRWMYVGIMSGLIIHLFTTVAVFAKLPPASFLLIFHGIVTPSTLILYVVGIFSGVYGWITLFRGKRFLGDMEREARWFRRYVRVNKYLLLCWILASQATVFGCWKFVFAQNLDETFSHAELMRNPKYEMIVRRVIQALPHLLSELEETHGIGATDPPLDLIKYVGIHYVLFLFLLSVIPAVLLYGAVWVQQKYYVLRYLSDDN